MSALCLPWAGCRTGGGADSPAPSATGQPETKNNAAPRSTPRDAVQNAQSNSVAKIVAFGDSLTAGLGLLPADSYTGLLQNKIDQDNYKYDVVNAGVSGDTTADGVSRLDWSLDPGVKILILELGANDILRMQPVAQMKQNLTTIIDRAKSKHIEVLLAGMEAPTNLDPLYRQQVHQAFQDLARTEQVRFIPFILKDVGGVTALNQKDGIHPNAEGEKIMASTVYDALKPMLKRPTS